METEMLTPRLRLVALTLPQLDQCLEDPACLELALGITISPHLVDDPVRRASGYKMARMSELAPRSHPWYTYWLVILAAERHGVGLVGFKGAPNERGEVEIGYGIDVAYRNQGYTTEAVTALISWAFQDAACKVILADTLKDNIASSRVLAKVGMQVFYETDDGLCWRLPRGADSLPQTGSVA